MKQTRRTQERNWIVRTTNTQKEKAEKDDIIEKNIY